MRRPRALPTKTSAIDWMLYDLAKGLKNIERKYGPEINPSPYEYGAAGIPEEEEDEPKPVPHDHVEKHLSIPIGERLRQDLEDGWQEHGHQLDNETFCAALLDLGLQTLREKPHALNAQKVNSDRRSSLSAKAAARRNFRRKWEALCRDVARGCRSL